MPQISFSGHKEISVMLLLLGGLLVVVVCGAPDICMFHPSLFTNGGYHNHNSEEIIAPVLEDATRGAH